MNGKIAFIAGCCLLPASVFAGGVDMEFFGYKVCDVSFDANPFSRDDGRPKNVCFTQTAVQYYTPPPRVVSPASSSVVASSENGTVAAVKNDPSITIKDSSNVTIVNQESRRTNQSMYAPSVSYPTTYTTYPTYYYARPTYYVYPSCYGYPYYRYGCGYGYGWHRPCHPWW